MITPTKLRELADLLVWGVERYPEGYLDMGEARVKERGHQFGTIHCFAGWVFVFYHTKEKYKALDFERYIDYESGVILIENLLDERLNDWAEENILTWGNQFGASVFSSRHAFTPKGKERADNLTDIANHLYEVADRYEKQLQG